MKKITQTILLVLITSSLAMAQAVLPTSYSWNTGAPYPTGWSAVDPTVSYYTSSSSAHTAPSLKMDATGDKVTINFGTTPGTFSYWLCVNGGSGTISGTFNIEESTNGTTWTTLRSFVNAALAGAWTQYTDTPNALSRYVRFNYVNRSSGNVGLDDVALTAGVSPNAEISVKQGGNTIVNGGTFTTASPVSTLSSITFSIFDLGLTALNILNINITGAAASDYVLGTYPSSVSATSNANFNVDFTPSASGTRSAVMTITNSDATNNPYIINLDGIGGTLATEPVAQATNITFPINKSYRIKGQFTAASTAPDGYLVLRSTAAITDVPVDGTVYQRGDRIGTSQVVYSANTNYFFPNNIIANTTYYFAVFSYNGVSSYRNYLTTSPLTANVTSSNSMQPSTYYNGIATTASTFLTDLHNKINSHTIQFYSNYGPLMISKFYMRDTTANQRVVTCVYSGLNKVFSEPWDWLTNDFSREHTYCNSWQPTTNNSPDNTSLPEYNDYHMITPTNQNSVNSIRSDYPLGEVVGTPTYTYLGCKLGLDANGRTVFEPRDSDKGDAARCMLYEATCYTGVAYSGPANTNCTYGGSWSLPSYIRAGVPYGQDQNVLKRWNYMDPPDNMEIARNDYVDSLQGNRNPFIDSMQYVCYIDFSTMTKMVGVTAPCSTAGIADYTTNDDVVTLAPNPSNGNFVLNYSTTKNQKVTIKLYDLMGRIVYTNDIKANNGFNVLEMNLQNLNKGIYTFEFISDSGRKTQKLIIQ